MGKGIIGCGNCNSGILINGKDCDDCDGTGLVYDDGYEGPRDAD